MGFWESSCRVRDYAVSEGFITCTSTRDRRVVSTARRSEGDLEEAAATTTDPNVWHPIPIVWAYTAAERDVGFAGCHAGSSQQLQVAIPSHHAETGLGEGINKTVKRAFVAHTQRKRISLPRSLVACCPQQVGLDSRLEIHSTRTKAPVFPLS